MAKKRVLIVDDETDVLDAVKFSLELEGIECLVANDGIHGLEEARRHQPDLILLDVMLPKLDGYEITRRLRSDPACEHIPIIMLSARAQAQDISVGEKSGADGYVTKPFDIDDLVARVKECLDRRKPARQEAVSG